MILCLMKIGQFLSKKYIFVYHIQELNPYLRQLPTGVLYFSASPIHVMQRVTINYWSTHFFLLQHFYVTHSRSELGSRLRRVSAAQGDKGRGLNLRERGLYMKMTKYRCERIYKFPVLKVGTQPKQIFGRIQPCLPLRQG